MEEYELDFLLDGILYYQHPKDFKTTITKDVFKLAQEKARHILDCMVYPNEELECHLWLIVDGKVPDGYVIE